MNLTFANIRDKFRPLLKLQNLLWLSLLAYLLGDFFVHTVLINFTPIDLSEQILWTQDLKLGYGIQPPLYSYLQIFFNNLFGTNLFVYQALHEVLIAATFVAIYVFFNNLVSQNFANKNFIVTLATFSFAFVTGEFIEILVRTHTCIAVLASVVSLVLFQAIIKQQKTRYFLLLAMFLAMGVLAKYNFVFVLLTLFIAALLEPEVRRKFFKTELLLAISVLVICLLPNLLWLKANLHSAVKSFGPKVFEESYKAFSVLDSFIGTSKSLLNELGLSYLLPFIFVFVLTLLVAKYASKSMPINSPKENTQAKTQANSAEFLYSPAFLFLKRLFVIQLVLLLAVVYCFKVSRLRAFWFQPIFFYLPGFVLLLSFFSGKFQSALFMRWQKLILFILCGLLVFSPWFKYLYFQKFFEPKLFTQSDFRKSYLQALKQINLKPSDKVLFLLDLQNRNVAADLKLAFPQSYVVWLEDTYNNRVPKQKFHNAYLLTEEACSSGSDLKLPCKLGTKKVFKFSSKIAAKDKTPELFSLIGIEVY